jgi:hypothetical protein
MPGADLVPWVGKRVNPLPDLLHGPCRVLGVPTWCREKYRVGTRANPLPDLLHGHRVPGCRPFPFFLYRKGGGIYIYRKCLGFFAGGRHPAMVKAKAWSNLSRVPTPGLPPDLGQKSLFFGSFWVEPGTPSAPAVG